MTIEVAFTLPSHLPAAAAAVREALARAAVVALPTETFYGLAVDPLDAAAVARVFALKGRGEDKALPVVVADLEQAAALAVIDAPRRTALARVWPAPLTVVLPARRGTGGAATIALRVPGHELLRSLLARVGALTATSANRSGQPPCADPGSVLAALGADVAVLLDGGATPGGAPSTLIDWTAATPRLLRQGAWRLPPSWP